MKLFYGTYGIEKESERVREFALYIGIEKYNYFSQ